MKINRLETHDRLLHLKKDQEANVFQGAEDCLKKNPDSLFYQDRSPYIYMFAHPRTSDDGLNKRLIWQPRLVKPKAETNSYLFRAKSHTDIIETIWIIPPMELWGQYKEGNVLEHQIVNWSIDQYINNKKSLEMPDMEDLSEEKCKLLLRQLIEFKRMMRGLNSNSKPQILEESSTVFL